MKYLGKDICINLSYLQQYSDMQRCHREHSKFPENLLRGSEATEGGRVWGHVWSFFVLQCGIVCSGAYFRGYFHIFLHNISVFNWVLGTYCHIVIKKKKKKMLPSFWKFPEIRKFPEMWHLWTWNVHQMETDLLQAVSRPWPSQPLSCMVWTWWMPVAQSMSERCLWAYLIHDMRVKVLVGCPNFYTSA